MRALAITLLLLASACGESSSPCREVIASCESDGECAAGAACGTLSWEHGAGDICLAPCESELDCPRTGGAAGRCLAVAGADFYCYRECAFTSDCPAGWVCQPIRDRAGALSAVCLP